jgi:16S rRNA (adenine1518-N6/adenine1519-N6)-dimethyltransferase
MTFGEPPNSAGAVSATLQSLGIRPTKGKGQNFLISDGVVRKIVQALAPASDDHVVEIGPGLGILTSALAREAGQLVAIELDDRLAAALRTSFAGTNVAVLSADALTIDPSEFLPAKGTYRVAANLPYSVGAAIVRRFLELPRSPERMVVMLQKEVAQRMTAKPPKMSLLGVAVQVYAHPRMVFDVPPGAFKPRPGVISSVVLLEKRAEPLIAPEDRLGFFEITRAGFQQRRKQLVNSLGSGLGLSKDATTLWLSSAGIQPEQRAEAVGVDEWVALMKTDPR